MTTSGTLYIVATPLGNLADISYRAVQVLQTVDLIAAEDTRHSRTLLQHYNIQTPLLSLHSYNEQQRSQQLLNKLAQAQQIALISDAGTPLISDPGYRLVREARKQGIQVVPVPGASALIAALCASGLPTERFVFEGFLPAKTGARQKRLTEFRRETRTVIFYESPHRLLELIKDMCTVLGDKRQLVIARELTKQFETIYQNSLAEVLAWLQADPNQQKGEFVVLLQGCESSDLVEFSSAYQILNILLNELPVKQAASLAAQITGAKKNELYQWAVKNR